MRDFIFRQVSVQCDVFDDEGTSLKLAVTRTRNSHGVQSVSIIYGFDTVLTFNGACEDAARSLSKMLAEIADHPCDIPYPSQPGVH